MVRYILLNDLESLFDYSFQFLLKSVNRINYWSSKITIFNYKILHFLKYLANINNKYFLIDV